MQHNKKKTILVVDDLPENIDVLSAILSSEYNVKVATSGAQALMVATQQPDLILLDILMPEMDGYEVCRRLKSAPAISDIPVIFITALESDEDEMKGLSLGAVDYLSKPVRASIALARIRSHLELKQSRNEFQELSRTLKQQVRDEAAKNVELERLNLLGKLFDLGKEGVFITDAGNRIVAVNKPFLEASGYTRDEVLGQTPKLFQSDRHPADFYLQLWQQLTEHGFWQGQVWNKRKDGVVYPVWLGISVIRDAGGKVVNYRSTFSDINEHLQVQETMRHMALHDHLTGLPNRAAFNEQIERDIIRAQQHDSRLAVVIINLDRFKQINDTLGHAAGDLLLMGVGGRMHTCLRAGDFICRLGNDEFAIIMHDIKGNADVKKVCDKLLQSIAEPYLLNGQQTHVTLGMGIALFPDNARTAEGLLAHALEAIHQAKQAGRVKL
jgi:diguanylate cyclase (GGDEF)-like protein/PAS domain S-box-containing protein